MNAYNLSPSHQKETKQVSKNTRHLTSTNSRNSPPRIMIVSDAWHPQVNGVVRTLSITASMLSKAGYQIELVTPNRFQTTEVPFYPEIRLAHCSIRAIEEIVKRIKPHAIHIATEGPLGMITRHFAVSNGIPFTTSYHTRFPEYLYHLLRIPPALTYSAVKWFHSASAQIMVATESVKKDLEKLGLKNIVLWTRGVNTKMFYPRLNKENVLPFPRPIFLNVGRISEEKNIEAFLKLDLPGTKVVGGDGPLLNFLKNKYPDVVFTGKKHGEELASIYAASDVFVFPSKTDTFGNVSLEALASGLPVAAYPVPGPIDVIGTNKVGFLNNDLQKGALDAYFAKSLGLISQDDCTCFVKENYTWTKSTKQFLSNLVTFNLIKTY